MYRRLLGHQHMAGIGAQCSGPLANTAIIVATQLNNGEGSFLRSKKSMVLRLNL